MPRGAVARGGEEAAQGGGGERRRRNGPGEVGGADIAAVAVHEDEFGAGRRRREEERGDEPRDAHRAVAPRPQGELHERQILHLYTDANGNISTTQTFFGVDEIEQFWENTSSDELEKDGRQHFEEIKSGAKLSMDINSIPDTAKIGDLVGGRDYITGLSMKAPIGNVVLQINGDIITKNYTLEVDK